MQESDLLHRAGRRLDHLIGELRFITAIDLAERLGLTQERAVNHWRRGHVTLRRLREIAQVLGLSIDFFLDEDPVFADRGLAGYLRRGGAPHSGPRRLTADGFSTLMLTRLITANPEQMAAIHEIRIDSYDGVALRLSGTELHAEIDGYRRSLTYPGGALGGANAVLETLRLRSLQIIGLERAALMLPGGRFPCLPDELLPSQGGASLRLLHELRLWVELVHYCGRMPGPDTFAILWQLLQEQGTNFELLAYVFDTLKGFRSHFALMRHDALRTEAYLTGFIRRHRATPEALDCVLYAIEALPVCSFVTLAGRQRAVALLRDIAEHPEKDFAAQADLAFVARAARAFLPFVITPERACP